MKIFILKTSDPFFEKEVKVRTIKDLEKIQKQYDCPIDVKLGRKGIPPIVTLLDN